MTAGFVGLLFLATSARRHAWIPGAFAVLFGLAGVSAGFLGRAVGLARMEAIFADPEMAEGLSAQDKARIREMGTQEAGQCVKIGGFSAALPLLLGAASVGIGLAVRKKSAA